MLGTQIKPVTVTKDLGVYIGYLIFNEDITKTASDCMFKVTRVNRIKHLLDKKKTLIYLINAFVFSKLFYRLMVWSSTSKKNVRKLQLVQNYAYRIVAGLRKYDHVSEAQKSLKWLNVRDKLLFNDLVIVYKSLKNLTPGYLHGRFQYRAKTNQRDTRQNNDLTLPRYRLATGQKTFTYRGAKLYNSIAKDMRHGKS